MIHAVRSPVWSVGDLVRNAGVRDNSKHESTVRIELRCLLRTVHSRFSRLCAITKYKVPRTPGVRTCA